MKSLETETKQIKENNNPTKQTSNKSQTIPKKSDTPTVTLQGENVAYWTNVLNNLKNQGKIMLYTNLINTNAKEINDLVLGIEFPNGLTAFGKTVLEKPENMQELVKQISIEAGKEMKIKFIDLKDISNSKVQGSSNNLSDLGIPINIIDA